MDQFEALWAYQTEDIKADAIANEIRRSPTRQKLERARDYILDRKKQYDQIEEEISNMSDRLEILNQAISRTNDELQNLQNEFDAGVTNEDELHRISVEVSRCRDTLRMYESEINHISVDSGNHEKQLRAVRLEAAKAKQSFDQLKVDYDSESKANKAELEQQKNRVKSLEETVDPKLLEEYTAIKKHISPPVARLAHGQCSGCNTSLPSATLSKIRNGLVVECETCGRMIIQ